MRIEELSRSLAATSSSSSSVHEQLTQLQRSLSAAEAEKELLSDRLDTARQQTSELKRAQEAMEARAEQMQSELQRSESRANQLELQLRASKAHLEESAAAGGAGDNYLREELSRMRREATTAQDKIKELRKTVSFLEAEKSDMERRTPMRSPYVVAASPHQHQDQPDMGAGGGGGGSGRTSRAQIPLLSSSSGGRHHQHQHHREEGSVKLKILEQENERLLKKIRGLEQQLQELERSHGERIQELLKERRKEREREGARQKEALRHVEGSLSAREKIYKDRIKALEGQVDQLKEQVAKELRRRQVFIASKFRHTILLDEELVLNLHFSGTTGISSEMSELRQNLDASLLTVSTSPKSRLDPALLDRESERLSGAAERYARDRRTPSGGGGGGGGGGRRTPSASSRLLLASTSTPVVVSHGTSLRGSASVENLHVRTTTAASGSRGSSGGGTGSASSRSRVAASDVGARRNLSFDRDA